MNLADRNGHPRCLAARFDAQTIRPRHPNVMMPKGLAAMPPACRQLGSSRRSGMRDALDFDLVAIGGGFAGLCAARN
jgi:hypothetical protein